MNRDRELKAESRLKKEKVTENHEVIHNLNSDITNQNYDNIICKYKYNTYNFLNIHTLTTIKLIIKFPLL